MPHFVYKARDTDGLAIDGVAESADELSIVNNLGKLGYKVVHIEEKSPSLQDYLKKFKLKKDLCITTIFLLILPERLNE